MTDELERLAREAQADPWSMDDAAYIAAASPDVILALLEERRVLREAAQERRSDGVVVGGPIGLHECPACRLPHDFGLAEPARADPYPDVDIAFEVGAVMRADGQGIEPKPGPVKVKDGVAHWSEPARAEEGAS